MSWTNSYLGVPYLEKGGDRSGWDCLGLLRSVYSEQLGIEIFAYADAYEGEDDLEGISSVHEREAENWVPVELDSLEEFDVLWVSILGQDRHVMIYAGRGLALHSIQGSGTCLVRIESPSWKRRIARAYRHRQRQV